MISWFTNPCRWWRGGHCDHYQGSSRSKARCSATGTPTGSRDDEWWHYRCCKCGRVSTIEADYGC